MTLPSLLRRVGIDVPRGVSVDGRVLTGRAATAAVAAGTATSVVPHMFHGGDDPVPDPAMGSPWWDDPAARDADVAAVGRRLPGLPARRRSTAATPSPASSTPGAARFTVSVVADPAGGLPTIVPVLPRALGRHEGLCGFRPAEHLYVSGNLCVADDGDWDPQAGTPPRPPSPGPRTGTPPTPTGASAVRGPPTGTSPMPPRSPQPPAAEGQRGRLPRPVDHRTLGQQRRHQDRAARDRPDRPHLRRGPPAPPRGGHVRRWVPHPSASCGPSPPWSSLPSVAQDRRRRLLPLPRTQAPADQGRPQPLRLPLPRHGRPPTSWSTWTPPRVRKEAWIPGRDPGPRSSTPSTSASAAPCAPGSSQASPSSSGWSSYRSDSPPAGHRLGQTLRLFGLVPVSRMSCSRPSATSSATTTFIWICAQLIFPSSAALERSSSSRRTASRVSGRPCWSSG